MDTIDRSTKRWLAVAAAVIGLAAPAAAQPGSEDLKLQPPAPRTGSWPDFPPPPGEANKIPTRPADLPAEVSPPKSPIATTSGLLPAFKGARKDGGTPQAGAFPQPGADGLDPTPAPGPNKVWNVSSNPNATAPTSLTQPVERSPRDFGSGWKGVIKGQNHEGPAARIAMPRSGLPRPEWNWHGYDNYNQGRPETSELANASSTDMAPFMKYAHHWRPAVSAGGYSQPQQGVAGATIPSMIPATPLPATTTSIETLAPRPTGPATPSVTIPLDPAGRPTIQPTEYRAPLAPPPVVQTEPEPRRPKVTILPDSGGANGLPLAARQKISELCAGKCRNLSVAMQTPTRMTVSFLVKDQLEAELLTNMLGGLPELSAYKVDFEVQIGQ